MSDAQPTFQLICGDGAALLRERLSERSVDMVYADPPFGNRQEWTGKAGSFSDNWKWDQTAIAAFTRLVEQVPFAADLLPAIAPDLRDRAYLACMADILLGARRVLRLTGTLWLHFDDTMGAHLRVLGDAIFGPQNALGTVIWRRTTAHNSTKAFGRNHDTIACWSRSRATRWRLARVGDHDLVHGDPWQMCVDGLLKDQLNSSSKERVGYPTQKPVSLVEHFIRASTLRGDLVLDPTCGSGTTVLAARNLGRRAIGIDRSADTIAAAEKRLSVAPAIQHDLFARAA